MFPFLELSVCFLAFHCWSFAIGCRHLGLLVERSSECIVFRSSTLLSPAASRQTFPLSPPLQPPPLRPTLRISTLSITVCISRLLLQHCHYLLLLFSPPASSEAALPSTNLLHLCCLWLQLPAPHTTSAHCFYLYLHSLPLACNGVSAPLLAGALIYTRCQLLLLLPVAFCFVFSQSSHPEPHRRR